MTRPYAVFLGILLRTVHRRRPWRHKQPTILDGLTARIICSSVKEGVHLTNEEKAEPNPSVD